MGDSAAMKGFWESFSERPNVVSMMHNKDAATIDEQDRTEILELLPDLSGKDVVELGAGIGKNGEKIYRRFTGPLAKMAGHVWASDFIPSFIEKNKENHKDLSNITYVVKAAQELEFESKSKDHVFTNWLLMYLTDKEVVDFCASVLNWLKPGGTMHIRESCSEASSKYLAENVKENPTYYRHISVYIQLLEELCDDGYKLQLLWCRSVPTYIRTSKNWRQAHMLVEKVKTSTGDSDRNLLSQKLATEWLQEQERWDQRMKESVPPPLHPAVAEILTDSKPDGVLFISSGIPTQILSPFELCKDLDTGVMALELNHYRYSAMLCKANAEKDGRIRFRCFPPDSNRPWNFQPAFVDFAIVVDSCSNLNISSSFLDNIKRCLKPGGTLISLECDQTSTDAHFSISKELEDGGFYIAEVKTLENMTGFNAHLQEEITKSSDLLKSCQNLDISNATKWRLVVAKLT